MTQQFIEKKVHYLGEWQNNVVDNTIISHINSQIQNEKGNKVKLQLSGDGLRIVKNSVFQGKMLQDYTPIENIKFLTVNQRMPNVLYVIALTRDGNSKFQVQAFRCENGMEAGIFIGAFKSVQKTVQTVTVKTHNANQEEINWTLRNKGINNSKRELKKLVDLHGEKAVVHKTSHSDEKEVSNGHAEVYEHGVRIPIYRKGKPAYALQTTERSFDDDHSVTVDNSDNRSEVSESALRVELESLSQELRDIKLMLEKSTGIASEPGSPRNFEQKSPREFKPMNVKVHTHAYKPEVVVINQNQDQDVSVDAVVIDDEPVEMRNKQQNGYYVTTEENTAQVRVAVPDYRSIAERTTTTTTSTNQKVKHDEPVYSVVRRNESGYGSVTSRTSTTSYESWKKNTMERNAVRHGDFPERIQWKSRSNRASHVVAVRPRSALPSWSTDTVDRSGMVEVRHHTMAMAPQYQHVSFDPRVAKRHERKTQSVRVRGMPSTVVKPIHKVYSGRADAKHGSMSYRPQSGHIRQSILVKEQPVYSTPVVYTEQNNNVVKTDTNTDDTLLDVSGIDLYKETPIEGAVIRT